MGTYTTNYNLYMPTIGEQGWGKLVNGNFTTIDNTMSGLNTRMGTAETNITSLTSRIGTAETTITSNVSRIGTLETEADTFDSRINSLEVDSGYVYVKPTQTANNTIGSYTLGNSSSTGTHASPGNNVYLSPTPINLNPVITIKRGFKLIEDLPITISGTFSLRAGGGQKHANWVMYVYKDGVQIAYKAYSGADDPTSNPSISFTTTVTGACVLSAKCLNPFRTSGTHTTTLSLNGASGNIYIG